MFPLCSDAQKADYLNFTKSIQLTLLPLTKVELTSKFAAAYCENGIVYNIIPCGFSRRSDTFLSLLNPLTKI